MNTHKIITLLAALFCIAACSKDNSSSETLSGDTFFASFESVKSSIDDSNKVIWEAGDEISINGYLYVTEAGGETAEFKPVSAAVPEAQLYIAVYPATMTINGTTITGEVAASQEGLSSAINCSVAKSSSHSLYFKNALSLFRIAVNADGVKSVKITNSGEEIIQGSFSVDYSGDNPVTSATGSGKTVSSKVNGKGTYYIAAIPATLASGIALEIEIEGADSFTKTTTNPVPLKRSEIMDLGIYNYSSGQGSLTRKNLVFYAKPDGSTTASGLSPEKAVTFDVALRKAIDGDKICLAAGTYTPQTVFSANPAVSGDAYKTFEISKNIEIEGASSANTILDGGGNVYHIVAITAPAATGKQVKISSVTIKGGNAKNSASVESLNRPGAKYSAGSGGGLFAYGANIALTDVIFTGNTCAPTTSGNYYGSAIYIDHSTIEFDGIQVTGNTKNFNNVFGTLYFTRTTGCVKNSLIKGNETGHGGAVHLFANSGNTEAVDIQFVNTEISGNTANARGGGVYIRSKADVGARADFINCTICGNQCASYGSGIEVYSDNASYPSVARIVSCTITGNTATSANTAYGGAVTTENAGTSVEIYNSIISGNIFEAKPANANIYKKVGKITTCCSINGADVLDSQGGSVKGQTFDPATMLSEVSDASKITKVYKLVGDGNPALTYGMTVTEVESALTDISPAYLEKDQWGNARNGKIAGAYVGQ